MILAFDTSGPVGSVAVASGSEVLARAVMTRQGSHASALIPTIDAVLRDAGVDLGELTSVVVGEGPGSFTGVRVAAATAKGLTRALSVPLRAVSSLAAAALIAESGGGSVRALRCPVRASVWCVLQGWLHRDGDARASACG